MSVSACSTVVGSYLCQVCIAPVREASKVSLIRCNTWVRPHTLTGEHAKQPCGFLGSTGGGTHQHPHRLWHSELIKQPTEPHSPLPPQVRSSHPFLRPTDAPGRPGGLGRQCTNDSSLAACEERDQKLEGPLKAISRLLSAATLNSKSASSNRCSSAMSVCVRASRAAAVTSRNSLCASSTRACAQTRSGCDERLVVVTSRATSAGLSTSRYIRCASFSGAS